MLKIVIWGSAVGRVCVCVRERQTDRQTERQKGVAGERGRERGRRYGRAFDTVIWIAWKLRCCCFDAAILKDKNPNILTPSIEIV